MRTTLCLSLLAFGLASGVASGDSWKDESGHGRRSDWNRQDRGWRDDWRRDDDRWQRDDRRYEGRHRRNWLPPPPPDRYRHESRRYESRRYDYDQYQNHHEDRYGDYDRYHHPPKPDKRDSVYTPWGYYEEAPRHTYDANGRRLKGEGQVGPFRFEIWK